MGGTRFVWVSIIVAMMVLSNDGVGIAQLTPEKSATPQQSKPAPTTKKYTVWVYKLEGGAWSQATGASC